MRLFLALVPPPEIVEALEAVQDRIPLGHIVPPENLHLTLVFLGEVSDREVEALHDGLDGLGAARVEVALTGLAVFGDPARVVAAEARRTPELEHLHAKLRNIVHAAGLNVARERFRPHVTLARLPRVQTADDEVRLARFLGAAGAVPAGSFFAREVVLFQSRPGKAGPNYDPLASYPLM